MLKRPTLGADLRALRKTRGLTLADLASRIGKSVGWLSQVERNITRPATGDLECIADRLGVPLSLLTGPAPHAPDEHGRIVRASGRRRIGPMEGGLSEELLSPDLTDSFEMIRSTFAPGSTSDGTLRRETQEVGFMISGQLALWIDGHAFTVGPGDSFRIRHQPFRWSNPFDDPAVAVWVISPPVY
ncbi:helix-turn-helix domain-containing protein [Fluviibacterium sp. DFM31]|uniref:Helix-turn-helix domain-containing protein n=1 Tax=Meridianimarinicoccus marinus TaxID=3231483 RepID=A0ABV3L879_9RHOB